MKNARNIIELILIAQLVYVYFQNREIIATVRSVDAGIRSIQERIPFLR